MLCGGFAPWSLHGLRQSFLPFLQNLLVPQQDNRYTVCRPFGFCDQHHVCCQHCTNSAATVRGRPGGARSSSRSYLLRTVCLQLFKVASQSSDNVILLLLQMCLTVLIDLGVPISTKDDFQNTAASLCSEHFKEGGVLLMEALQAQTQNVCAHGPCVPAGNRECSICMQQEADSVLVPCGHLCVCHCCASRLQGWCPICRANTSQVLRVYHT